ncbi:hypothetical protein IJ579_00660 [bacterium]|nr:hypothetical protein [bacterium]
MNNERRLFENGCFLPGWQEADPPKKVISQVYTLGHKDLDTLLSELEDIKQHIQDVRQREWQLAKMLNFHSNNFATE